MVLATLIALWLAAGLFGSYLFLEFAFRRGSPPLDVDVGTLIVGALFALSGPLNLIPGLVFFFAWLVSRGVDTSRVVFPARRAN